MIHLEFALEVIAFSLGVTVLVICIFFHAKFKNPIIVNWLTFVSSMLLFLLMFILMTYNRLVFGGAETKPIIVIHSIVSQIAHSFFIYSTPFFLTRLLFPGSFNKLRWTFHALGVANTLVLLSQYFFFLKSRTFEQFSSSFYLYWYVALIYLMIAFCLTLLIFGYRRIGNVLLRKGVVGFFILTAVFAPFFVLDFSNFYFLTFKILPVLPLYFLIMNFAFIFFSFLYFNHPPYMENTKLSRYFISEFNLSEREREVVELLLAGNKAPEISAALFISQKTVESHIYNVYKKARVKNRIQLFNLVRTS